MGFDCEIEQLVQMQYSVTPVRADRIGVTLAADPNLRSSLEPESRCVVAVSRELDA